MDVMPRVTGGEGHQKIEGEQPKSTTEQG